VRKELKKRKVNYFVHFKVEEEEECRVSKKEIRGKAVNLMSLHQSKGLEFDMVLFIDPQYSLMNRLPFQEDMKEHMNLMYVGVTRAKESLHMFLSANQVPHIALADAIDQGMV